jgi:hypothetical protein
MKGLGLPDLYRFTTPRLQKVRESERDIYVHIYIYIEREREMGGGETGLVI